eukprot:14830371-Alexandrium_andersonii.AAC.1
MELANVIRADGHVLQEFRELKLCKGMGSRSPLLRCHVRCSEASHRASQPPTVAVARLPARQQL